MTANAKSVSMNSLGMELALADLISVDRFKDAHKISEKVLKAIIRQVPQEDLEGAS